MLQPSCELRMAKKGAPPCCVLNRQPVGLQQMQWLRKLPGMAAIHMASYSILSMVRKGCCTQYHLHVVVTAHCVPDSESTLAGCL